MSKKTIAFWSFVTSHAFMFFLPVVMFTFSKFVGLYYQYQIFYRIAWIACFFAAVIALTSMIIFFSTKNEPHDRYVNVKLALVITILVLDLILVVGFIALVILVFRAINSA